MVVHERTEAGVTFLRPESEHIDAKKATELKERLDVLILRGDRVIALDLVHVEFMDSTGLGTLISALRRLGHGGELLLCGARQSVMSLLRLTSFVRIFSVYASEEELLAARVSRI
jgi:anti-sigma B factor antagonist